MCVRVCVIFCKPRCNPEQEAGQGVTVGVKAPLLPWNTAVDCFTQCPLIWSPYRVSAPLSAERLQPSSPSLKPTNRTHSRSLCVQTANKWVSWFIKMWDCVQQCRNTETIEPCSCKVSAILKKSNHQKRCWISITWGFSSCANPLINLPLQIIELLHHYRINSRCFRRAWESLSSIWFGFLLVSTSHNQEIACHVISPFWALRCWISPNKKTIRYIITCQDTSCNKTETSLKMLIYFLLQQTWHKSSTVSSKNKTRQQQISDRAVRHSMGHRATTCQQGLCALSPAPPFSLDLPAPLHLLITTEEQCVCVWGGWWVRGSLLVHPATLRSP